MWEAASPVIVSVGAGLRAGAEWDPGCLEGLRDFLSLVNHHIPGRDEQDEGATRGARRQSQMTAPNLVFFIRIQYLFLTTDHRW